MAKVRIENSVHGFTSDDDLPKGTNETVREGDVVRGGFKNGRWSSPTRPPGTRA